MFHHAAAALGGVVLQSHNRWSCSCHLGRHGNTRCAALKMDKNPLRSCCCCCCYPFQMLLLFPFLCWRLMVVSTGNFLMANVVVAASAPSSVFVPIPSGWSSRWSGRVISGPTCCQRGRGNRHSTRSLYHTGMAQHVSQHCSFEYLICLSFYLLSFYISVTCSVLSLIYLQLTLPSVTYIMSLRKQTLMQRGKGVLYGACTRSHPYITTKRQST
jgi:hypothetical protein